MAEVDWSKASGFAIVLELLARWLTLSGIAVNVWAVWYALDTLRSWLLF